MYRHIYMREDSFQLVFPKNYLFRVKSGAEAITYICFLYDIFKVISQPCQDSECISLTTIINLSLDHNC